MFFGEIKGQVLQSYIHHDKTSACPVRFGLSSQEPSITSPVVEMPVSASIEMMTIGNSSCLFYLTWLAVMDEKGRKRVEFALDSSCFR